MPHDRKTLSALRQRLEAVRAAGIEWLPRPERGAPSIAEPASRAPETVPEPEPMPLFFDETPSDLPAAALSPAKRKHELEVLAAEVAACMKCSELCSTRTQTVFGTGPIDVEICCIGEAPGADEDRQGQPFVGAAGQLLNNILRASGFKREEVYICNILKCRPPANRTPKPEEAANCRGYLEKQLALVRPKALIAFGGTAAQNLLQTTASLGKLRGRFHDYKGLPVLVTYHPAYLLPHRSPGSKALVWEDMKMLLARLGREVPMKKSN